MRGFGSRRRRRVEPGPKGDAQPFSRDVLNYERRKDALSSLRCLLSDSLDIDFVLNDGFPMRALDIVKLLTPRPRPGGVVLTDDVGGLRGNFKDYLAYMRDRANGCDSMLIPLKGGTEYSVRR